MWFFYLELYQHGVGVYSYNCNMELNANLAPPPPTGRRDSKKSLGRSVRDLSPQSRQSMVGNQIVVELMQ